MSWKSKILMSPQGDGDGGGSGTGLSALTTGGQASESAAPAGQSGTPSGASGQTPPPNTGGNASGTGSQDWRTSLPQELQDNASLKKFTSLSSLASGYLNAEKLIGAEKIAIPGKHATDEDWMGVYKKLGLPAETKDYLLDIPEDKLPKEEAAKLAEVFHKQGILPKQAKAMMEHFMAQGEASAAKYRQEAEARYADGIKGLQTEWGAAFDAKMSQARLAVKEYGSPELTKLLDSGAGNEPAMIKLFAKIGETLKEGKLIEGGQSSGAMTPDQAKLEINKIMGDSKGPYHTKSHPNHAAAVAEVQKLFAMAYPAAKK